MVVQVREGTGHLVLQHAKERHLCKRVRRLDVSKFESMPRLHGSDGQDCRLVLGSDGHVHVPVSRSVGLVCVRVTTFAADADVPERDMHGVSVGRFLVLFGALEPGEEVVVMMFVVMVMAGE